MVKLPVAACAYSFTFMGSRDPGEPFSYVCTGGRGTERFIADELLNKVQGQNIEVTQGKVFFQSGVPPSRLLQLKCVERLFVCIARLQPLNFSKKRRQVTTLLHEAIASIPSDRWVTCAHQWERFQSPSVDNACMTGNGDTDSPHMNRSSVCGDLCWDVAATHQEKTSCFDGKESVVSLGRPVSMLQQPDCDSDRISCGSEWSDHSGRDRDSPVAEEETKSDFCRSSERRVTFRMSCKCTGRAALVMTSQELSSTLGSIVSGHTGWVVNLKEPLLEVYVHCSNDQFVIGLPVTKCPLSRRPYISDIGLRCPVAWIIATLADIKPGQVVLDPMCGAATILLEAAVSFPDSVYIGLDSSREQVNRAVGNVTAAQLVNVSIMQGSAADLPFSNSSIDAVVCDLPFGQKHSTNSSLEELYYLTVKEMMRVTRNGSKLVLLTSPFSAVFLQKAITNCTGALKTDQERSHSARDNIAKRLHRARSPTRRENTSELAETGKDDRTKGMTASPGHVARSAWVVMQSFTLGLGIRDAVVHVLSCESKV